MTIPGTEVVTIGGAAELREHLRQRHGYNRRETDSPLGLLRSEHETEHELTTDHTHERY